MSYLKDLLGAAYKEGMSEAEISSALESAKVGNSAAEIERLKASLSKVNSEAAEYKKQLRAKQTDDEAAEQARKEEHDRLTKENKDMAAKIAKMEKMQSLTLMGYDKALAESTAEAMISGDMDTVLANQNKFLESRNKAQKAANLRSTPRPATGSENSEPDYQKKAADAKAAGDWSTAAYYTRLAEQANVSQN